MSRFFVPKDSVKGGEIRVSGKEAHHILDVMRLTERDKVSAFDGTGKEYEALIKRTGARGLVLEIVRAYTPPPSENLQVTLIQALPKKEKMDYIVEKATELGVYCIIPVITKRTIVKWNPEKASAGVSRWQKISTEAAKQCGRVTVPAISGVSTLADAVKCSQGRDLKIIAALCDGAIGLKAAISGIKKSAAAVAIGPEGDFTPEEVECARGADFKPVSLGRRVLKSDTAGLAVLSILNYESSE